LKAHLAKRGFADIDVNMTGGYDPNSTSVDSGLIKSQIAVLKNSGIDPILLPRSAGSWPGYVFTGAPLNKPAGHFGLGHGSGAHCAGRIFCHRIVQSEGSRHRRGNDVVCSVSIRAREIGIRAPLRSTARQSFFW